MRIENDSSLVATGRILLPFKQILIVGLLLILGSLAAGCGEGKSHSVLVVTGGHSYDEPEFEEMFRGMAGVDPVFVLKEEMQEMSVKNIEDSFDAIVFLDMLKAVVPEAHKQQFRDLTEQGVGMVFLHFTIASRPYWDEYHEMIGGNFHLKNFEEDAQLRSVYLKEAVLDIKVLNTEHPVTEGIEDFAIDDTAYANVYVSSGVELLLGTEDERSSREIAWTHRYKNSKVVYMMPGFRKSAYQNPSYSRFVENAIRFVSEEG